MLKVDGAYLMFALVLAAVSLMLIIPPQSYAANAAGAAPQLQRVTGGAGQCVIPKSKDCPASSIAGENIAGHIISCGYCQPACGLMCGTGGPSDGGEASSIGCVGTFVGGGSYSSSQTTYCNGGYDNSFSMSLPSGSYANYECSDAPAQASYSTGGSGWYDQGQCQITNYNDTTTHYDPYALNGQIAPAQPSPVSQSPLITNVLNDNTANALWLLSCPSPPGGGAAEYFSSNLASFLGGDMCLANNAPLTSGAKVTTSVSWGPTTPPTGILDNITFTNIGAGTINDIAYSGATNAIASSTFDISNGYNTQSYIFQQVPAQAQHGVWGWDAKRADFSGFNSVILSHWQSYSSQSFDGGSSFAFIQNLNQQSYQWTCSYSYKLSTSINIQSIQNANIPLDSNGGSPVSVLPYFLYNISLPSTTSELNYAPTNAVLNLSLDLYSPHNFQSPQQNLDPFPFYTDAGFFAGQSSSGGSSSSALAVYGSGLLNVHSPDTADLSSPTTTLLSALSSSVASGLGFNLVGTAGTYATGQLPGPTFISSSPDDFVYALSTASSCGWLCFTSSTTSNLYVMRFIPKGDYNLSNYQPGKVAFTTDGAMTWNTEWNTYWTNAQLQQSQNLYVTNIYNLQSASSSFWGAQTSTAGPAVNMLPMAVASDYNNDVFVLGANTVKHQSVGGFAFNSFMIAAVYANGVVQTPVTVNAMDNNVLSSDEFTASPGGQFLYVANVSYPGYINIFDTKDFRNSGNISLSFTNSQYQMNVTKFLSAGGPYGNSQIAAAYKGQGLVVDQPSDHHPIAISDSQGIIYVLDNWTINVGDMHSAELLLRAFSYNGVELPIQYGSANTVLPTALYTYSGNIGSGEMPPYGWVLSANVATGASSSISYCVADCTFTPKSAQLSSSHYMPIGPLISATGVVGPKLNDLGFTTDFNGTSYLIAHVFAPQSSSTNILTQLFTVLFGSNPTPVYSELLVFRPSLVNYTKISLAADTPYSCYTDFSGQSPCAQSSAVTQMYPPVMGVPSSFYYLESQGSPQQYLSLQNVVSSLFPTGLNCQSTTAGGFQQCQQASQEASSISAQQLSSSLTGTSGATASAPVPQPNTYANTVISGYVLIPYKIVYTLGSGITSSNQYSSGGYLQGEVVAGTPPPNYYHCVQYRSGPKGGPAQCVREEPGCQYPIPSGLTGTQAQGSVVQYAYGRVNLPKSNSLNNTIEGGGTYVQFTPGSNYYIANISDAAMITIPRIDTQTFTNRLFGAMYINSTITPSSINPNGYTSPMVMNAVQALNYRENFFVQQSAQSTASYPAFSLQQSQAADPSTLSKVGPTCGGSCPSQYYYSTNPTKIFQGNTQLSYANYSQLSYLPLFELVQQASEVYYAGLSTPENSLLGYNRLIYTLVDRFNNVIHMPLGVDLANLAQISLSPVVTVNALNANETTIDVTGMATYTNSIGTYPLPAGSPIYIYYDTNINFFSPTLTPGQSPSEYYQYALQCAFGTAAGGCPLADPLATYTQGSTAPTIADTITFHTNYDKNPGECAPEPQSLLTTAPADQCNIYGNFGLPSTTFDANIGSYQYCDPLTSTGNGILTSQMGLAAIVKTDSAGSFNSVLNVCGTGAHKVVAQFYGSPGPEPFPVTQTPLTQSAGQYESFSSSTSPAPAVGTNLEYGYVFSPNTVAYDLQVGSYALGFGSVGTVALVAIAALIVAFAAVRSNRPVKSRRAHNGTRKGRKT